jgi:hypothetical protein
MRMAELKREGKEVFNIEILLLAADVGKKMNTHIS